MADRTCGVCGHKFDYPSRLKRHQARANPCVPPKASPPLTCKTCGKAFTEKTNYYRHLRQQCDAASLGEVVRALTEEVRALKLAAAAAPAAAPPPVYNTLNVQINGVPLRDYGHEDTTHLRERISTALNSLPRESGGLAVICEILRTVWADPQQPQNRTVMLPNQRGCTPHVRSRGAWVPRAELELYPDMISRACTHLQQSQSFTAEALQHQGPLVEAAFRAEDQAKAPAVAPKLVRPVLLANAHDLALQAPKMKAVEH